MRVLLIEDDTILGAAVRDHIVGDNHSVDWVGRLDRAAEHLDSAAYDLVLLDLMLPDGRGSRSCATCAARAASRRSSS
jgi:two-component system OmpR family response regulator